MRTWCERYHGRRLTGYLRQSFATLVAETMSSSEEWRTDACRNLQKALVRASDGMRDASPAGAAEYYAVLKLLVDYLFENPRVRFIDSVRRKVENDLEEFDQLYRGIHSMQPKAYSDDERGIIDQAALYIRNELSKLSHVRPA